MCWVSTHVNCEAKSEINLLLFVQQQCRPGFYKSNLVIWIEEKQSCQITKTTMEERKLSCSLKQEAYLFFFRYLQVVFEGVKGTSYTGDIAIDDVKIMSGSCPAPGDCSFENGLCTWTNILKGDVFDWVLGGGGTPSWLTGPSSDHTTGSGMFIAFVVIEGHFQSSELNKFA